MSPKIALWAGIIGVAAAIPCLEPIAVAKTSVEIGDTARSIVVLITDANGQGSGVILQHQGDIYTVLTAAHVVADKSNYKITTADDRQYPIVRSSIRTAPGNIDLAIVKFRSTANYPTAKLGNSNVLRSGMDLYVAGFPAATKALTESVFVLREGKVSANSHKIFEAGYSLIYSNDTLPGMSGGAVLNSEGELVAIHGKGDREERSGGQIGVKTGFNVGIPINRFATVAKRMGVALASAAEPIPEQNAPKADDYIASARQKYGKGDYRGSLADFDRAIQLNPNYIIAYNYRGLLKTNKLQDDRGGLVDFDRAIQLNPNFASAYNYRGLLKANKLLDIQGGLADYNRAIQLDPNLASAYNNRGLLKEDKLQDVRGGLADLDRAIQLDATNADAYNNRGSLKADALHDIQGGLADYNRAIQLDPNLANAYYNRGTLKANKLQDLRGGLADFDRAIQLNPNYTIAYNNRGTLKANKLHDIQGGLADYNRAIEIDPSYANAYGWRSILKHSRLNDRAGAIADMQQAAKLYREQGNTKEYQRAIAQLKQWRVER